MKISVPKEIEDVLHLSPDVAEASVVSIPHKRLGEGVCAFIILKEGRTVDIKIFLILSCSLGWRNKKHLKNYFHTGLSPELPLANSEKYPA